MGELRNDYLEVILNGFYYILEVHLQVFPFLVMSVSKDENLHSLLYLSRHK